MNMEEIYQSIEHIAKCEIYNEMQELEQGSDNNE